MKNEKPFVHIIHSPYAVYAYDVNTNTLLPVSQKLGLYLEDIYEKEKSDVNYNEIAHELEYLQNIGYLSERHPSIIEDLRIHNLEYFLQHKLERLTLQVTQQCNFRCSYCTYSNEDDIYNRNHTVKKMTFETAKRAIDFFAERIRDSEFINMGFYGGEPLLEFELIKKIIEYSEWRLEGKELNMSMTTNGVLLTPERFRYLVSKNTNILVSLDGAKEAHNRGRKFAENGKGTFDAVYTSLKRLKKECSDIYNKLSFNCVIDPMKTYKETKEFFEEDLFFENEIITPILEPRTGAVQLFSEEFNSEYKIERLLGLLNICGFIKHQEAGVLSHSYIGQIESFNRKIKQSAVLGDIAGHGGPCLPGAHELFVGTDGNFYPCEKVSEISPVMNIGNLTDGFNYENIKKQLNIASLTAENCKNCWALVHCVLCARQVDDLSGISKKMIRRKCRSVKINLEQHMKTFIAIRETSGYMQRYIMEHKKEGL